MKKPAPDSGKIAKSAGVVGAAVMLSRMLGLVREQIFAAFFGAGYAYDAFVVAFRIPNLLRDLFGEGALSAAFVTVFSQYDEKYDAAKTWQLASNVLTFLTIVISLLTIIAALFADYIVDILAPGFAAVSGKKELTVSLTRIMLPFLLFISLSAVVMGMLNTKGRFFIPSLASSFFNLGSILGGLSLVYLLPKFGFPAITGMAVGTLIGGMMQLGVQLPALRKTSFRYRPHLSLQDPGLRQVVKLMLPATIGLSAVQINIFVNTSFAASCGEGSVSWLNYAFRLVQLPIGLFGVAMSIAVLPVFGRYTAQKNIQGLKDILASSLTMVFCLTLPAAAGLIILADDVIRLIFEHGVFTALDTAATAQALSLYALGLFAYSANKLLVPAFYALDDTKIPVISSFLSVLVNIIFIYFTIETMQHLAIALSTSVTMLLNFLFLSWILYRKLAGFSVAYLLAGLVKILAAAAVMSILTWQMKILLSPWLYAGLIQQISATAIIITLSVLVYAACLYILKLPELMVIAGKIKDRFC
ncbi:MAG: murein biosynthesis integral membrane protein MurJ [Deltaproteobacteria bacterium]|nr:MAG: murein biosynthesis integral membrane protein MurJ [Deltaproteobacteria bacterium]